MLVYRLDSSDEVSAVVRIAPALSDIIEMTARNEATNATEILPLTWQMQNGRMLFTFDQPTEFKAGNKYEVIINNTTTDTIIYRGKMIVVNETTDIQNYTPSNQQPPRYKQKDPS